MRPSVLAVSLAVALLMPGAAALADPPWERGREHEARGCKYEYKAGPHGFEQEYKCDGGGPRYAGGPPPWAPAHGWRRKHARHYEAGPVIADLGIEVGRCNRDVIGAVIGGAIGRSMDQADHACLAQTLERAPAQHAVAWRNPDGGHYRIVPLEGYEDPQGRICRDYRTTATIGGRQQQLYGTACRQPDGSWQRVS